MGRFLKIAVYIAVLFLGYLWIATVAKSCNKTSTDDTELVDEVASQDEFADDFADDFFDDETEESDESLDEMGGGTSTEVESDLMDSSPMDYTEVDEIIEENQPTKQTYSEPDKQRTAKSTSSSSGKYLLLAGSYLIEDNASTMVRKLNKMGYNNAEVVVFDMSQYHSVCAGRYSNMSTAKQECNSLKRQGVDNYVHTRQ